MQGDLKEILSCEVCGSNILDPVLDLGLHPMCDDLVPIGENRICEQFPIEILFCNNCSTAHQRFQIPKHRLFPSSYHFRSRHTSDILIGMNQLVDECEATLGSLAKLRVLDIGCNDGSLLSFFSERHAETFGIEPTDAAIDGIKRGHTIINDYLSEEIAEQFVADFGRPDIITFTNVFAHIENLADVLAALDILSHEQTIIVIENHYLGSILEKKQFDSFYHEHPRTYSYSSFIFIAKSLGRSIIKAQFPQRYGGNIRIFMGRGKELDCKLNDKKLLEKESYFGMQFKELSLSIEAWRSKKIKQLNTTIAFNGPLAAKAFPGRSAILIKLLGIDEHSIFAVYEKAGSAKVGHYVPGTRIPIYSDNDFGGWDKPLLNLAWHISDEVREFMCTRGFVGDFIDILGPEDFISDE